MRLLRDYWELGKGWRFRHTSENSRRRSRTSGLNGLFGLSEQLRREQHGKKRSREKSKLFPAVQHRSITEQREAGKTEKHMRAEYLERGLAEQHQWPNRE